MAETVIDKLIVKLGIDSREFDAGQKKTATALNKTKKEVAGVTKDITESTKKSATGFGVLTKSATGFLALIGGTYAVKRFVQDVTQSESAIYRLSKNIDVSASSMNAFGRAAYIAGGSAEGIQNTLATLSGARTEYSLTGNSALTPLMSYLGLFDKFIDKTYKETDLLRQMNQQFSKMDREQAYNVGKMFGIDEGTMNFLLQAPKEFDKSIAAMEKANNLTDKQVQSLNSLDTAWRKAEDAMSSYFKSLVADAAPFLTKILNLRPKDLVEGQKGVFNTVVGGAVDAYHAGVKVLQGKPTSSATQSGKIRGAAGSPSANDAFSELVKSGESGGNYDIANMPQKKNSKGKGYSPAGNFDLTSTTIAEVLNMQKSKQILYAGAYQMGSDRLSETVAKMKLSGNELFSKEMQDRIFKEALPKATKDFLSGKGGTAQKALLAAAKIWRSLPTPEGGTYQDKYAYANKAGSMPNEALGALNASRAAGNTNVTVGHITVTTQATDAKGIAKDMHMALNDTYAMQANSGMQ